MQLFTLYISIRYIYRTGNRSDIEFKVGQECRIFKAHKILLKIGSEEFERILNLQEHRNATLISIPAIDPNVFEPILKQEKN